ncbi:MAG: hypothetical protein JSR37_03015 [Verrucomicrobia bacterium]|nr:hypothetical protein [Verrucomicrobiota bacterium]MBS0636600.1 hypothetical protein [Verrucomicrobiota bacterium]
MLPVRYVSDNYSINVGDIEHPYSSIVTSCTISRRVDDSWEPIQIPFITYRQYKLEATLQLNVIRSKASKIPEIDLVFFEGTSATGATIQSTNVRGILKHDATYNSATGDLSVSFNFTPRDKFRLCKSTPHFLYAALKIDKLMVKFIACDIAVFSSAKKVSPDGKLAIGKSTQNLLQNKCFWFSENLVCTMDELQRAKKQKKELTLQNRINILPQAVQPFYPLMQMIKGCADDLEQIFNNPDEKSPEEIVNRARMLINAVETQLSLCELPLPYLPIPSEEPDFTLL